jgi:orotidine-5'-phosphate decarboxylase
MAEIIVALDVPDRSQALGLVERLGDAADFYKVGLQLFTGWGPAAVTELRERGKRVFLDLKLHDIPNTVASAVHSAGDLGAELVTVHASGGEAMLRAAVDAAEGAPGNLRILGVTVLTSLGGPEIAVAWGRERVAVEQEVLRLGALAAGAGVHGLVASAREAGALRNQLGPAQLLVTPGIRLAGGAAHDQSRVMTPRRAVEMGADCLVVGRAVTADPDPVAAFARVRAEIAEAA